MPHIKACGFCFLNLCEIKRKYQSRAKYVRWLKERKTMTEKGRRDHSKVLPWNLIIRLWKCFVCCFLRETLNSFVLQWELLNRSSDTIVIKQLIIRCWTPCAVLISSLHSICHQNYNKRNLTLHFPSVRTVGKCIMAVLVESILSLNKAV